MQDIRVQVYLESLEIDVHESTALFRLLQNGASPKSGVVWHGMSQRAAAPRGTVLLCGDVSKRIDMQEMVK